MITNLISVKDFTREKVIYYFQKAENIEIIDKSKYPKTLIYSMNHLHALLVLFIQQC